MSERSKRGLGRGLGALLGDGPVQVAELASGTSVREIAVDRITPNPFQPRKNFDRASLADLQASIAEHGVLVPIIVRERGDGYELVAGERRWRACAALQMAGIPAIVRRSDDRDTLEVAIVENLQREDLNPLEEAAGFVQLIDEHDYTQEQVAHRLGRSRPAIANALRLLSLPEAVKGMLVDGRITAGHARALLAAPEEHRLTLARRVADEGLSVRALERLAGVLSGPVVRPAARVPALTPEQQDFESRLRVKLGAYVALRRSGKGGRVEIRYTNEKDLMRIADALLGDVE